jgi:hypothetical protein
MRAGWQGIEGLDPEHGWPCQRLRLGWSLVLFFFFETLLGHKLPLVMPYLMLAMGVAMLVSAQLAIREWKLATQLAMVQDALERRFRS